MSKKIAELQAELAEVQSALKIAEKKGNQDGVRIYKNAIAGIEKALEKEKESVPAPAEKAAPAKQTAKKKTKKAKPVAKPEKKVVEKAGEKKKIPTCEELAQAYTNRMSAVKKAAGKKTTPIMKIIADKMEGAVRSAISYNKDKGGDMDIKALKEAVKAIASGFDKLKDALKGEFEDLYIDKFKEDLMKIIQALDKKQK